MATGTLKPATWSDVKVGDVVQVKNREGFPADMIILATHEPDPSNPHGACSVETKSLDGETNLKEKTAPSITRSMMGDRHEPNPRGCCADPPPQAALVKGHDIPIAAETAEMGVVVA